MPGHGGFTDRMDCQIVMGMFAYIYQYAVTPRNVVAALLAAVCSLSPDDQALFRQGLESSTCG